MVAQHQKCLGLDKIGLPGPVISNLINAKIACPQKFCQSTNYVCLKRIFTGKVVRKL